MTRFVLCHKLTNGKFERQYMQKSRAVSHFFWVVNRFCEASFFVYFEFYNPPHSTLKPLCKSQNRVTILLSALAVLHLRGLVHSDALLHTKVGCVRSTLMITPPSNPELQPNAGLNFNARLGFQEAAASRSFSNGFRASFNTRLLNCLLERRQCFGTPIPLIAIIFIVNILNGCPMLPTSHIFISILLVFYVTDSCALLVVDRVHLFTIQLGGWFTV